MKVGLDQELIKIYIMNLRTKGKSANIDKIFIGKIESKDNSGDFVRVTSSEGDSIFLCKDYNERFGKQVFNIKNLEDFNVEDVISANEVGGINILYRKNSFHNTLLFTERCNSNCLMCSQPPKDKDDTKSWFYIHSKTIPLIAKDCFELGISGGEPTILGDNFYNLVQQVTDELPNTSVHVLTNGRNFAKNHLAERLGNIGNSNMMLGIPLYSDFYQQHDYIVQAKNAFYQTILGLHNLNRYNVRLEIRIVLHKQTIGRLKNLSEYIYKNLPFVEHVTFMGLEYVGYTPHNIDKLWIDPYSYKDQLEESVMYLADRGMRVSIYNTQLCLLNETSWEFAKKSISDWKNEYLEECNLCNKKDECAGFFRWNLKLNSAFIKPII